ncbi:MAG: divergent PAP2 family protein [Chloroflexi bacterium]|jgi:acid phosphatase family membrane protein YuiD|nr:divergent PAP2 family protein [Chloroflexota bacterium]
MDLTGVLRNPVLIGALIAWSLAQGIKLPIDYLRLHRWNWSLLLSTGGMPSSHSTLVTAIAHGTGMVQGFDSPAFAVAVVLAMVVIYDATGIRRQAGLHAEMINAMVQDLMEGHQLQQERLAEVLGHSPAEAAVGLVLGIVVSTITVLLMRG